ncbi:MAG: hypothetical protein HPY53_16150 [Brevinematales bacterium]|nr:hypothetical protein [Brevinematales bacterium]
MRNKFIFLFVFLFFAQCAVPAERISLELNSLYVLGKSLYDHYHEKVKDAMFRYTDPQVRNKEIDRLNFELTEQIKKIQSDIDGLLSQGRSNYSKETMQKILDDTAETRTEMELSKKLYENTLSRGLSFIEV